ncbi:hypothetical protein Q4Q35_19555 [Flavivirga aquimarina]|uniref:Fe2OG dioxygenase domain-containing protein n=1 Tax=Flavivirga aquimarina TaxID=2027862 RepID=A0ABT8WFW8_9FLAO|nr:hypothetical protein [Flavivirga aquimarina]MDO5972003.1 hypothetical protein [Flavivirga aquimarina]
MINKNIIYKLKDSLLAIYSGNSDGIIHLKNAIDFNLNQESIDEVKLLNFEESKFNNRIARYEITLDNETNNIVQQLSTKLIFVRDYLNLSLDYSFESFAFKYYKGHFVPEHIDRDRHKLIALTYFGDFTGGDYVYLSKIFKREIKIFPKIGDVIISINEGTKFDNLKLKHKVDLIQSGIRYTIATSLVSNK